jgi:alkane 1-monooxygenase
VLHGLVAEWGAALAVLALLGPGAFAAYVLQAVVAVRLLEAVNYLEHWGITRRGNRPSTVDSWDTDSRFTLYALVGLSRHADHHAHAWKPYQQLEHVRESPKLPYGYFGTVWMVLFADDRFRAYATEELRRRRLGPFATAARAESASA